jgi:hypothetical protein
MLGGFELLLRLLELPREVLGRLHRRIARDHNLGVVAAAASSSQQQVAASSKKQVIAAIAVSSSPLSAGAGEVG